MAKPSLKPRGSSTFLNDDINWIDDLDYAELQFEAARGPRPCSITRSHLDAEGKLRRLLTYLENEPQHAGATTGFSTHNRK